LSTHSKNSLPQPSLHSNNLQGVIFSHVGEAETLGQQSIDDLIAYKTKETHVEIGLLKSELTTINQKIMSYEEQLSEHNRKAIENLLKLKQEELNSHDTSKPREVTKPETDAAKQKEFESISKEIEEKQNEIKTLDNGIKKLQEKQNKETRCSAAAENLLVKINNFERQFQTFRNESSDYLEELGLNLKDIVNVKINRGPLKKVQGQISEEITRIQTLLDP